MRPLALRSLVAACVVLAAALGWLALRGDRSVPEPDPVPPPVGRSVAVEPAPAAPPRAPEEAAPESVDAEDLSSAWAAVDLEAVRRALPDNTYWESAAPTDDPRILEQRDAERAHWNDEFGKVQSGTATDEEIEAYFDHRFRVSSDYVEFVEHLLAHYGNELPPRDVALLELAQRMHLARLVELPRKLEEAHARKRQQDAAREAWLEGEAEFADEQSD